VNIGGLLDTKVFSVVPSQWICDRREERMERWKRGGNGENTEIETGENGGEK
jgi:hypothetical protein